MGEGIKRKQAKICSPSTRTFAQYAGPSEACHSKLHSRPAQPRGRHEIKMLLFKRLLTSCILFLLLSLAALTGIGMAVGMQGGWYRPPVRSADSSYVPGHDIATRYGYVIFLKRVRNCGPGRFLQRSSTLVPETILSSARSRRPLVRQSRNRFL